MTQKEISNYLDIPFATLNDWKQENSNRFKLFDLLKNLDLKLVESILSKKNNHRIFHILNRNIDNSSKFSYDEIKKAFSNKNYHNATIREQTIYSKFFREIEPSELDDFVKTFNVSKRDIKNLYISSSFRNINGIAIKWDRRFRLKHISTNIENKKVIPSSLQKILNKKNLSHV